MVSERSEVSLAAMAKGTRIARWRRIAVASAKQCGWTVVPPIHDAVPLDWYWTEHAAASTAFGTSGMRLMCVEPSAALGEVLPVQTIRNPRRPT